MYCAYIYFHIFHEYCVLKGSYSSPNLSECTCIYDLNQTKFPKDIPKLPPSQGAGRGGGRHVCRDAGAQAAVAEKKHPRDLAQGRPPLRLAGLPHREGDGEHQQVRNWKLFSN